VVGGGGRRVVVGNGYLPAREVTTGAGTVGVTAPRVHDPRPGHRFSPAILLRYVRRSPQVTEVLPVLGLRGLSTGDFAPALAEFLGSDAGLGPSNRPSTSFCSRFIEALKISLREYSPLRVDADQFGCRSELLEPGMPAQATTFVGPQ